MSTTELRNMNARNFGLRNRDINRALKNAAKERGNGKKTVHDYGRYIDHFSQYLKDEKIKDLRDITREDVYKYSQLVKEQDLKDNHAASTTQTHLSAINTTLEQARGDKNLTVNPVRDANVALRNNVRTEEKARDQKTHDELKMQVSTLTSSLLTVQREIGLREKESILLNANNALKEAEKRGVITISRGTKGGKVRETPMVRSDQIKALKELAKIQTNEKINCIIPLDKNLKEIRNKVENEIKGSGGFHAERHFYIINRYEELAKVNCPIQARIEHKDRFDYISKELKITVTDARKLDHEVRLKISKEVGHERIDITNSYLG